MSPDTQSSILALIPARGGSKRIPRKNVVDFHGKPIIAYPIEAASRSGLFGTIHVSTDDAEIRDVAQRYGADVSFERPSDLSDDMTGVLPVARWVLHAFAERGRIFQHVVILFPCAPLIDELDLRAAWNTYQAHRGSKNLLTVGRNPVPAEWLYRLESNRCLSPLTPGAAFIRSQDLPVAYYETGGFTIFSAQHLLRSERIADDCNYIGHELASWKTVDIDTPEDLDLARALYAYYGAKNR